MRIFTFGCSFSNWLWPTWPDIIAYDNPNLYHENWALYGTSNVSIYHRLVECNLKNNFTEDDVIIVGWTTWSRDNFYKYNWANEGNLLSILNDRELKKRWCPENDIIKNSTAIISANKLFNISYQFDVQQSLQEKYNIYSNISKNSNKIIDFYYPHLNHLDVLPSDGKAFNKLEDYHPDVKQQLEFVKNKIYPSITYKINKRTEDHFSLLHQNIYQKLDLNKKYTWKQKQKFFGKFYNYKEIYNW